MEFSETLGVLDDDLSGLHHGLDALDVLLLQLGVDLRLAVKAEHDLGPLEGHPGRHHLRLQLHHPSPQRIVLDQCLALHQHRLVLLCLSHHASQVLLQLNYPILVLLTSRQEGAVRTLRLAGDVWLVPLAVALVAELTLANALHV